MRISILDHTGKEVGSGRDLHLVRNAGQKRSAELDSTSWKRAKEQWERPDIQSWDFGPLPESISLDNQLMAYPGLSADGQGIRIRLFDNEEAALESHRKGVEALLLLHFSKDVKFLRRNLAFSTRESGAKYFETVALLKTLYMRLLWRISSRSMSERLSGSLNKQKGWDEPFLRKQRN
jgi:ATP-dependent helicase HrpA